MTKIKLVFTWPRIRKIIDTDLGARLFAQIEHEQNCIVRKPCDRAANEEEGKDTHLRHRVGKTENARA